MVRTVCLGENDHAVNMLRSMKQMKYEHDLCDFVVKVGGDEYPTHKNVLAAGSPYFKAMFKHDTAESRDGKVEMKEVDSECVKSCIDLLYSGSLSIPDGKIGDIIHVAVMLQLDKAKQAISDILYESLNVENFYETRDIAEVYNIPAVSKKCETYYEEHFMAIYAQPEFENEEKSHVVKILKSKKLKLSEEEKLMITLRWVGDDPEKKENLSDLIKLITMRDIPPAFLNDLLKNHPVISNDLHLYKLISDSLIENIAKGSKSKESVPKKLVVVFDQSADCLRSYDPVTDKATEFHNEKFNHFGDFTAVSMGAYIYALSSNRSVHRLNFRDKSSKWERMQNMIADHGHYPPVVAFSGSLFVIGSSGRLQATRVVEQFDPVTSRWSRWDNKPEAIRSAALVSFNDSIFCIGGWNRRDLKSLCRFTPFSSKWVDLEPMKNAKRVCSAVVVKHKIFVTGGYRDPVTPNSAERDLTSGGVKNAHLNEVECYDVTSGQWTSLSPMIALHGRSVSHHIDGWIVFVSRYTNSNGIEKYDIEDDRWQKVVLKDVGQFEISDSVLVQI